MKDEALWHAVGSTDLFVEIDPQQKEQIVRALQRTGYAVGYLGDGINDALALHAADVGISVDQAVDVARESADIILLRRDLVSDLPSIAISTDNVDREQILRPQRWNVKDVQRFMMLFGLLSSCFDLLTFAIPLLVFRATESSFQTTWFVVSVLTELAVVLVLRTHGLAWRSRPSRLLVFTTLVVCGASLLLPYSGPIARIFGFSPMTPPLLFTALVVVAGYIGGTEATKVWYYRRRAKLLPQDAGENLRCTRESACGP